MCWHKWNKWATKAVPAKEYDPSRARFYNLEGNILVQVKQCLKCGKVKMIPLRTL